MDPLERLSQQLKLLTAGGGTPGGGYPALSRELEGHHLIDRKSAHSAAKFLGSADKRAAAWARNRRPPGGPAVAPDQDRLVSPDSGKAEKAPTKAIRPAFLSRRMPPKGPRGPKLLPQARPVGAVAAEVTEEARETPWWQQLVPAERLRCALLVQLREATLGAAETAPSSPRSASSMPRWSWLSGSASPREVATLASPLAVKDVATTTMLRFHVRDIAAGTGWVQCRTFGQLKYLRQLLVILRPSIETIPFPGDVRPGRGVVNPVYEWGRAIEAWIKRMLGLVFYAPLHDSNLEVQQLLQAFLGVGTRVLELEATVSQTSVFERLGASIEAKIYRVLDVPCIRRRMDLFHRNLVNMFLDKLDCPTNLRSNKVKAQDPYVAEWTRREAMQWALSKVADLMELLEGILLDTIGPNMIQSAAVLLTTSRQAGTGAAGPKARPLASPARAKSAANQPPLNPLRDSCSPFMRLPQGEHAVSAELEAAAKLVTEGVRKALERYFFWPLGYDILRYNGGIEMEDRALFDKVQSMQGLGQQDLGVNSSAVDENKWEGAITILQGLCRYRSDGNLLPCEMQSILLAASEEITRVYDEPFGTDAFLPAFQYCLFRAQVPQMVEIAFVLRSLCTRRKAGGRMGYVLTTYEAAVEHLKRSGARESP